MSCPSVPAARVVRNRPLPAAGPAGTLSRMPTLLSHDTPSLVLDLDRMTRNNARMRAQAARLGVSLRPHVKTAKSIPIVRAMLGADEGPVTVSTLREAELCLDAGIRDIVYAVGIAPSKLPQVLALRARGARLMVLLDSVDAARAVGEASRRADDAIDTLIEIDCDGHRAGVAPDAPTLTRIADVLATGGARVRGVLTHAGESYHARSAEAKRAAAAAERDAVVRAAARLRDAGHAVDVVSVGSTPTALFADDLTGVTELRAGVYVFQDLVMAGIGVCDVDDVALSVLVTVIGHQPAKGWIITDGGWMALSRDRGTASQPVDQGYGVVCDVTGRPLDGLLMVAGSQEHGIVARRADDDRPLPSLPVGTRLRILPNHACATAAQHAAYAAVRGPALDVAMVIPRTNHW